MVKRRSKVPYISQEERSQYDLFRVFLRDMPPIKDKGNLEYMVYLLMLKFMSTREQRYGDLHEAVYGTVHSAHEFERNFLDKRENLAKQKNGDIQL